MGGRGRTFESFRPDQICSSPCPLDLLLSRDDMDYSLQVEQETGGRWIAEAPELPGVFAYGAISDEAIVKAEALALRVMSDRRQPVGWPF